MTDRRNELLLAALRRAGGPMSSDALLDAACGLAEAEGWSPAQLVPLTRRAVATRLRNLEAHGEVVSAGESFDASARRMTPSYVPAGGYAPGAPVPPPPEVGHAAAPGATAGTGPYAGMERAQLLAVLDAQDVMLQEFAQLTATLGQFFVRLDSQRERLRARLVAAGVEG